MHRDEFRESVDKSIGNEICEVRLQKTSVKQSLTFRVSGAQKQISYLSR